MDRNYKQAMTQVAERIGEATDHLVRAGDLMIEHRPEDARDMLSNAQRAIEGALTSAQWATTLPRPEDER